MRRIIPSVLRPRLIPMITAALLVGCAVGLAYVGYIVWSVRSTAADGQASPRGLPLFGIAAVLVVTGGLIGRMSISTPHDGEHFDW